MVLNSRFWNKVCTAEPSVCACFIALPVVEVYNDILYSQTHPSVGCYRLFCTSRHPRCMRMFTYSETTVSTATQKQLYLMLF